MEEEEKYSERTVNNVSVDTLIRSPVAINAQKKDADVTYERRIALGILAETKKEFKGCTIKSTISDSAHSDSEEQCHKQFQGTDLRRKQSKKGCKQRSKGSYLHYQRKFSTKIIEEAFRPKDDPRRNTSD